jgi:hypothetical protein
MAGVGLLFSASIAAQIAEEGTRVRVTAPDHIEQRCVGHVVASDDPLLVKEKHGTVCSIPLVQIELLEVSRGRNRTKGALIGAGVGGVALGVLGVLACDGEKVYVDCESMFLWGGLTGAIPGALLGLALAPERWSPVWRREMQTHLERLVVAAERGGAWRSRGMDGGSRT